jgi:Ser/Thr protein kinase RdoA (MazF antagonist)
MGFQLDPEHRFAPTPERVGRILAAYDLTLRDFRPPGNGMENTTLLVDCAEGPHVLRIYRLGKKTDVEIDRELAFVQHLRARGIPIPRVLATRRGERWTKLELDGAIWQALVMERIAGRHAEAYTPALLADLAGTQARMHLAAGELVDLDPGPALGELADTQFAPRIDLRAVPDPRLSGFVERARQYRLTLDPDLPCGLCHLDYDPENVLVTEEGAIAAVLDFDDLALAPYVVDLAYTTWHVRFHDGEAAAARYLSMYEAVRPLSDREHAWLAPIERFRHYVICSLGILEGAAADAAEVERYLALDAALRDQDARIRGPSGPG